MPEIRPFKGLRYNQRAVDLASVIAPPYDVISTEYQNELYGRSPHNVVRLILGREADRYSEASGYLESWKREGILKTDDSPALYILDQVFRNENGHEQSRFGFIGACRVTEFGEGRILPHEKTHSKPKEDRLKLLQATRTNLSQIFSIYSDPEGTIDGHLRKAMEAEPAIDVSFESVRNRVWVLTDQDSVETIAGTMRNRTALIADGHHRYETALAYRDMMRLGQQSGDGPFEYTMMFFCNLDSRGLIVFPTHRVVHDLEEFDGEDFLKTLGEHLEAREVSDLGTLRDALTKKNRLAFGVITADRMMLCSLPNESKLPDLVGADIPADVRGLDVMLLHTFIMEQLLSIGKEAQYLKKNIDYVKETDEAVRSVRNGSGQIAFLMNPTRMEQIRRVAKSGLTMPQKSTFFYPKLVSGLVMNPLGH